MRSGIAHEISSQNIPSMIVNVLRGWPAVILSQAIDDSHYKRYPEIQRRFIITNPKMSTEKYSEAINLIGDKYGLPDFAYQEEIINDADKEKTKRTIRELKDKISACVRLDLVKITSSYHSVTQSHQHCPTRRPPT
jgi:hypothetical protein